MLVAAGSVALVLGVPAAVGSVHVTPPPTVSEGGCPDGSEPYGVLIEKSGAAYLVCRDKKGGGLIYVPLTGAEGRTADA